MPWRKSDDDVEDRYFLLHASLGLTILVLATIRLWWRRSRPLPPWAPTLSPFERRYAHAVETVLYVLMFTHSALRFGFGDLR